MSKDRKEISLSKVKHAAIRQAGRLAEIIERDFPFVTTEYQQGLTYPQIAEKHPELAETGTRRSSRNVVISALSIAIRRLQDPLEHTETVLQHQAETGRRNLGIGQPEFTNKQKSAAHAKHRKLQPGVAAGILRSTGKIPPLWTREEIDMVRSFMADPAYQHMRQFGPNSLPGHPNAIKIAEALAQYTLEHPELNLPKRTLIAVRSKLKDLIPGK